GWSAPGTRGPPITAGSPKGGAVPLRRRRGGIGPTCSGRNDRARVRAAGVKAGANMSLRTQAAHPGVPIAMNRTDLVERPRLREDLPDFRPGDTVRVHVRVAEAGRERIQVFQGVVIRRQGGGLRETFTVRKISFGIGVERTFPLHSPTVSKIEVMTQGRVRRA